MIDLIVVRTAYTKKGTLGTIYRNNLPVGLCLERPFFFGPDKRTVKNESCIPPGVYKIKRTMRHAGKPGSYEVFQLEDVEGGHRTAIQIHRGNFVKDTLGCLLVGISFFVDDENGISVQQSRQGFNRLMKSMEVVDSGYILIREQALTEDESRLSAHDPDNS
mgnify:FL=1|jgi:hypothetical protein|tara:strand:- start:58 stop:543 length:486 start_codon:yes stop_codon:yes gene_type:complete